MHTLNFFLIAVIWVSLFFKQKFAYLVTLLCSLTAATFIYIDVPLSNILFTIAIFNITPLVCVHLVLDLQRARSYLEGEKARAKGTYEAMLKQDLLLRQSLGHLENEVAKIVELYQVTRDMSFALSYPEICQIFFAKLISHFKLESCRMILMDESKPGIKIKQVFALTGAQACSFSVQASPEDEKVLNHCLASPKISYEEARAFFPLMAENKLVGAVVVEGLKPQQREYFAILINQFLLEFKRVRLYQKIQELAITDGLTGLFVRRYFRERLEEEIKRSLRHQLKLSFLMIDIDHFKRCNDRFGHLSGDAILREISALIKGNIREIDLAARYGGEEFSVLLPDTDKESACQAAERIRENVDRHTFRAYNEDIKVEVSIGVSAFPQDAPDASELIDKADQALYRAKDEGRNRVRPF